MKIGICDDDKRQLELISELLDGYLTLAGEPVEFVCFESGMQLLDSMDSVSYDALFMDILMKGYTGMDAAYDIRLSNSKIPIVFLTSSPEFAVESYRVHAFDYILKPINAGALKNVLDRIYDAIGNTADVLRVDAGRTVYAVPFNKIEFLEVRNHTLCFHMFGGSIQEIKGRLSDYEDVLLARPEFFKTHRSFIVNFDKIKTMEGSELITVSGKRVGISRNLIKETREAYVNRLHNAIRM